MFKSPVQSPFQNPFPTEGALSAQTYGEYLRDDAGSSEVFNLTDMDTQTIKAFINSNRNGTSTGWNLQSAAGPVTGTLAPYSDGVNDIGDVLTSNGVDGSADIWDWSSGSVFLFTYSSNYLDGVREILFRAQINSSNQVYLLTNGVSNNKVYFAYRGAGALSQFLSTELSINNSWNSYGFSWGAGGTFAAINGVSAGSLPSFTTATGLPTEMTLLANTGPAFVFKGYGAYVAIKMGNIWSIPDFLAMHNAAATSAPDLP